MTKLAGRMIVTNAAGERRIVLLPRGTERSARMRKQQVILVCDGCSTELEQVKGTSRVTVDVHEGALRKLDFCIDCTAKLPEGIERKRPGPRTAKK